MLKNLSYEKKNRMLIIAALLFGFVVYSGFVKKTIETYGDCKELHEKMEIASNAPIEKARIQKELVRLNSIIGSEKGSDTPVREALLSMLTGYCQDTNILLREFPSTLTKQETNLMVETNIFTIEGSFAKLLRLIYELEQKQKLGKISSVTYQSKKDITTKKLILTATVYLQNIKKI